MISEADLAAAWPWMIRALIVLGVLIVFVLFVDAYRMLIRPGYKGSAERRRQEHLTNLRTMLEPALAGLWSTEMEKRMTALVLTQRLARLRSEAAGIAHILIAFIRHRLSIPADPKSDDGFEDVKLALAILGTRPVRAAQAETQQGIDLSGVNFRGLSLHGIDFVEFRLAGCIFDRCQMGAARLVRTDLSGASMVGADLTGANLTGANLSGADLTGADFTEAQLRNARLNSSNISGAVLVGTIGLEQDQLDEALGDSDTAVPEHFRFVPVRSQRPKQVEPPVRAAE
jgi:uncharacterized protein YjbI with pentapeptide repeats